MAKRTELERGSTQVGDLAPNIPYVAGATIPAHVLVQPNSSGVAIVGLVNSSTIIGGNRDDTGYTTGQVFSVGYGRLTCRADGAITPGQRVKCANLGYVGPEVDATLAGTVLLAATAGLGFANQPLGDQYELVSSNAGDTTQTVTAYYTRTGQGNTLFSATSTMNGTTAVASVATDVQRVLGFTISAALAGTLTLRKKTGPATIITATAGQLSKGVVATTSSRAYNTPPVVVGDAATTKVVGLIGTDPTGAVQLDSIALNGTTSVSFTQNFNTATFVLVGDLESARTAAFSLGAAETGRMVGIALEAATLNGDLIDIKMRA